MFQIFTFPFPKMSIPFPRPLPNDSWDCMLPGPPSRNNFGSADLSPSGLLAYATGSSVSVIDSRSLQLVTTIPLPPLSLVLLPPIPLLLFPLSSLPYAGPHSLLAATFFYTRFRRRNGKIDGEDERTEAEVEVSDVKERGKECKIYNLMVELQIAHVVI